MNVAAANVTRLSSTIYRLLILSFLFMTSLGCGSTEQHTKSSGPFTGEISAKHLIEQYSHFRSGYNNYQPSPAEIAAVAELSGKKLVVLFGTWCHDSEREVPRLLKLLDLSGVELQELSLYGVNYNKEEPSNLHQKFNLVSSPTIILLQDDIELGRIIEKPVKSLGEDLAEFVAD
ncbi:thioredoxin family protein [uncultured Paraglaciecola sp.]|uniref:TlpA family protein disulfide reductase n=1 Tax=uncultured Paraglaciecola sp. TaxID=1765024 RepID=UPI00262DDF24|nr:thioredoxin family protein [uncultured Paraglaciecola sp.]